MTVATKTNHQSARRYLMRKDPVLGTVIKQVGPCGLPNLRQYPPFMALAEAIASQQLSVKAVPDPVRLLTFDDATTRGVGFSRSKMLFLRDLATHVVKKRLLLDRLHEHNDAQVLQQLPR